MKIWTVYQVENLINGRLYIGVHKTDDPNDDYMGSGPRIQAAINKHGLENFRKKVLLVTEDKDEAFALEKSLVTIDRIGSGELYNLKEGGEGGWDWCNTQESSTQRRIRGGAARAKKYNSVFRFQGMCSSSVRARANSDRSIKKRKETFKRISHQVGERNSQFSKRWYLNEETRESKRFLSDPGSPWKPGRKMKWP